MIEFILACLAIATAGLGYMRLYGGEHRESFRPRALDIAAALGITFAVAVAMWLTVKTAGADEGLGLHSGGVRVGLYHEWDGYNHFCRPGGVVGELYGQPEAFVDVYRQGEFTATLSYQHNSCAFGSDTVSSDRAGIVFEYRAW